MKVSRREAQKGTPGPEKASGQTGRFSRRGEQRAFHRMPVGLGLDDSGLQDGTASTTQRSSSCLLPRMVRTL